MVQSNNGFTKDQMNRLQEDNDPGLKQYAGALEKASARVTEIDTAVSELTAERDKLKETVYRTFNEVIGEGERGDYVCKTGWKLQRVASGGFTVDDPGKIAGVLGEERFKALCNRVVTYEFDQQKYRQAILKGKVTSNEVSVGTTVTPKRFAFKHFQVKGTNGNGHG